ncbi:uncharacterized protein LOC108138214 [Drosophila elegans]|uniref:uncharacterized protein LOC108138214 n=1 Tax=Drosophila elegans TaxID=30023 RepID=UPI0007E7A7EF|nr:uncharacterized protein LOC108138214 [Drosophila elegans]
MVRLRGLLSSLGLLLAIYGVQTRFCGGSTDQKCVPRQSCRIGSENGMPIIEYRHLQGGNFGCPSTETCCPLTEMLGNPIPVFDDPVQLDCGHVNKQGLTFTIRGLEELAQEAEMPWVVALLDATNLQYKAAGSLIAPDVVLTASHVTDKLAENQLLVRAGEWDLNTDTEQQKHVDVAIRKIVRHPEFDADNGQYNVALLFLKTPLQLTRHINLICLPSSNRNFIQSRCLVGGWGKKTIEANSYMNIMKKIELPVVDSLTCEKQLQEPYTKDFRLHHSLMCAGGEIGKDSCEGDGGAPLACPLQSDPERYEQAGIVNFGSGCGEPIPAVYTDVSKMNVWIRQQIEANSPGGGGGGGEGRYLDNGNARGAGDRNIRIMGNGQEGRVENVPGFEQRGVPVPAVWNERVPGGLGGSGRGGGNVAGGGSRFDQVGAPVNVPARNNEYIPGGGEGYNQGGAPVNVPARNNEYIPGGDGGYNRGRVPVIVPARSNEYIPGGGGGYNQGGASVNVPSRNNEYIPGGGGGYNQGGAPVNVPARNNEYISGGGGGYNQGRVPVIVPARSNEYIPGGGGGYNQGGAPVIVPARRDNYIPGGFEGSNGGGGNVAGGGGRYDQGRPPVNVPAGRDEFAPNGLAGTGEGGGAGGNAAGGGVRYDPGRFPEANPFFGDRNEPAETGVERNRYDTIGSQNTLPGRRDPPVNEISNNKNIVLQNDVRKKQTKPGEQTTMEVFRA